MEDNFNLRHFARHGHYHSRGWHGSMQARRGDMKYIILNVLSDESAHGYDVIRKLEEKSDGLWKPSPGSVYPTLQLLEDEDLVTYKTENGKKIYSITDRGRDELKNTPLKNPWERWEKDDVKKFVRIRSAMNQIMPALAQINRSGDEKKIEQAFLIIKKATDELTKLAGP